jgi:hypothetical protein
MFFGIDQERQPPVAGNVKAPGAFAVTLHLVRFP